MMDSRTLSPHFPRARSASDGSFPPAAILPLKSLINQPPSSTFYGAPEWLEPWSRVSPTEAASSTGRGAVVTHSDPCRFGASLGSRFAVGRGHLTGDKVPSPCARPWEYPRVLLDALADMVYTSLKMTLAASSTITKLGYQHARPRSSASFFTAQAWEQG
ncbi:hypothetical protein DFH06DRAFT_1254912, partial [Mycena polygramma]